MTDSSEDRGTARNRTRSNELQERSLAEIPEGASSNVRGRCAFEPYTEMPFMARGEGAILTDVDGNEYVDLHCGVSSIIQGHCPDAQVAAVREQVGKGPYFATPHEHEHEAARLMNELLPASDRTKFISTGTEAVMSAISLARAYTGKETILKFEGMYHGHADPMLWNVHPAVGDLGTRRRPTKVPAGTGVAATAADEVEVLPWNDADLLAETLERRGDEIAAVITEGVLSNSGLLYPHDGYLAALRRLTDEHDVLLILDEVITGFRVDLRGIQGLYDLEPDLAVYGKALANGYPCAAVSGRAEVMDFIGGGPDRADFMGTFSGNPLVVAAAKANLEALGEIGEAGYERFQARGQRLVEGLREIATDAGHDVFVPDFAGFSHVYFVEGETEPEAWTDWRDIARHDDATKWGRFAAAMIDRGVYVVPRPFGRFNLSHAHTDEHVDVALEAAKGAFAAVLVRN